jgi:superfamily II DNA or RNA helicase
MLRNHQQECINKINEHFETENKGLIKMFCGSGKSFIIYHSILQYLSNIAIIVVPSINLITQFNNDYLLNEDKIKYNNEHFNKQFKLLTICSKNEININYNNQYTFTTNEDQINDFLQITENKIILITYQSLQLLCDIIKINNLKIDLMCFDEAHHILADNMKKLLFEINNDDSDNESIISDNESIISDFDNETINFIEIYSNKTLFFTATPKNSNGIKMYESLTEISIDDEYYDIINDDESIINDDLHCGKLIYEYKHIDGVNDNVLNDFNVRVDLFTENTDKSNFDAISRTILETGNNRVLTFHSRSQTKSEKGSDVLSFTDIENKNKFIKCFKNIIKIEFPQLKNKYKNIEFIGITANTKNKTQILKNFDETPDNEIFILSSCKTIGEGVDTKNANMIVFIDPKQSYVEIIQNIGRICRKNETTNKLATVLIPAHVDVSKYEKCKTIEEKDQVIRDEMSKTGNFNGILNVLSALRQEDNYMFELCLKYPELYTEKEITDNLRKNNLEILNETPMKIEELLESNKLKYNRGKSLKENLINLSNKLKSNIQIINNKILEEDIFIENDKYETTKYYIKNEDETYQKTKQIDETKSTKKINKVNRNIKPIVHINDEIKVLWEIESDINIDKKIFGGYIKSTLIKQNEEDWINKLEKVKKYIDENKKRPSSESKDKEIKKNGLWLLTQKQNYIKKLFIMKSNNIRQKWKEFIEQYSEYFLNNNTLWINMLEKVKNYINENKKRPSTIDKTKDIKQMGGWICHQIKNYKKNVEIMKDNNIKQLWEEFIEQYEEYFINNITRWYIILEKLKLYINEHKKRPNQKDPNNEISQLALWINTQQRNYRHKTEIMVNENVRNSWEEYKNQYSEYMLNYETKWLITFNKIKKYFEDNNKRPSHASVNNEIKQYGSWISNQQIMYNTNKMKSSNRKLWEEFIEQYQDLFCDNITKWKSILIKVKQYINDNNKRPHQKDSQKDISFLGTWITKQVTTYKRKTHLMKNDDIYNLWSDFIEQYNEYFIDVKLHWKETLTKVKNYIDDNKERPLTTSNINDIKKLGSWIANQKNNYNKKEDIMKNEDICKLWEDFTLSYKDYFSNRQESQKKKTTTSEVIDYTKTQIEYNDDTIICSATSKVKYTNIKPKTKTIKSEKITKQRKLSDYQELSKKMTIQKSETTKDMFKSNSELWHNYHDYRDFSFLGYDNQNEIPINKIINYLESKSNKKLKILDLGCGRNLIKDHFKDNIKMDIIGYDYVSFNESIECDISNLPEHREAMLGCSDDNYIYYIITIDALMHQ